MKDAMYIDCNEAAVSLTGYPSKESLLNARTSNIFPLYQPNGQSSAEEMAKIITKATKEGSYSGEWVSLRYDKVKLTITLILTTFVSENESFIHILWCDRSKQELKHYADSLDKYLETMCEPHLILKNGVYTQCNQAAVDLLGYPDKKSLLNKGRKKFYPALQPDGSNSIQKGLDNIKTSRQKGSSTFDWTYKKYNGSLVHTVIMMTSTVTDGEEELHITWRDKTQQLKSESDSIRQLLHKIGDASLLIQGGKYIDCNQAAADLLDYPDKQSLLNIHPIEISPTTQPDGRDSVEKANEIMSRGYKESTTYFEWTHLKRDGTPIVVEALLTPVQINNENMIHVIWHDLTDKKRAEAKIEKLAYQDSLTRLANRRTLVERLNHILDICKRTHYKGALLFIDLDHFKNINDTLGHDAGDEVLRQAADRLTSIVRTTDTVSRFGGDEFVIMLENLDKDHIQAASKAEETSEKLLIDLNKPYEIQGKELFISASIGVSMFTEDTTIEKLLQQSDIAMYQAKASGRNAIRFFNPRMQKAIDERATTEQLIKNALSNKLFELHYQLQVNEQDDVLGVEALLRLKLPEQGFIPPMQYIPIAEKTGLILHISNFALEVACKQLKLWGGNHNTNKLTISINVSPVEFQHDSFIFNVLSAIKKHRINPNLLTIELTETMFMDDIEAIILKMNLLKENGIQFSISDFGTGYSPLQYLRQLPLDQLKINKSLVCDLEHDGQNRSIVKTIIMIGQMLSLNVIAEGVENTQQQAILFEYGCCNYQGYLFSKSMSITDVEKKIKRK